MAIPVISDTFIRLHRQVFGKPLNGRASREEMKAFRSVYGASPKVCADIFRRLNGRIYQPVHLLWTMAFLKLYLSGNAFAKLFNVTRKTFFCYVWPGVRAITSLKSSVVSNVSYCKSLKPLNRSNMSLIVKRFAGRTDFATTREGPVRLLLMVPISRYTSHLPSARNGILINSSRQAFDMKWGFVFPPAILCGPMVPFLVGVLMT